MSLNEHRSRTRICQIPSRATFGKQSYQDDTIGPQDCDVRSPPYLHTRPRTTQYLSVQPEEGKFGTEEAGPEKQRDDQLSGENAGH